MKEIKSFRAAFCGLICPLKTESHLRFHLVAAVWVVAFSVLYGLSAAEWTAVILIIAAVIAAELFNTAVESLCDRVTKERDSYIKIAKDACAAGVLVLCAAAVAAAFIIYRDTDRLTAVFNTVSGNVWLLILSIVSGIISVVFVALGPVGIKKLFIRKK